MVDRRTTTVLMLDVVGSTQVADELGDARTRDLFSRFDRVVRATLRRFGGREEDHAGDGFFVTFSEPDRAIRCAAALAEGVRALGIEIRCGIHTGQTGSQGGKASGIAVVIGAHVMALADTGVILVTSTARELVAGAGFAFAEPFVCELKGVPGTWQVSAVTSVDGKELMQLCRPPRRRNVGQRSSLRAEKDGARHASGARSAQSPPPSSGSPPSSPSVTRRRRRPAGRRFLRPTPWSSWTRKQANSSR